MIGNKCAWCHKRHRPGSECPVRNREHEFVYRADHDLCSECGRAHGPKLATLDAQDELLARLAVVTEALRTVVPEPGYPHCEERCLNQLGGYDEPRECICGNEEMRYLFDAARPAIAATPEALTTWLEERDRKAAHEQEQSTLQAFGLVGGVEYREGESTADALRRWKQEAFARGVEAAIAKVESFNLERIEDRAVLLMITAALRSLTPSTNKEG